MKASELRIGNLLKPKLQEQSQDVYYEVVEINTSQFICEDSAGLIFYNDLNEPIPLTEEWLLKFGFELEGLVHFKRWSKGWFNGYLNPNDFFGLVGYNEQHLNIKYVHQLQNLYFALTGEELKLNK